MLKGAIIILCVSAAIGYAVARIIERTLEGIFKSRNTKKAEEYALGFKIRWKNWWLRELYMQKYNTEIEPVEFNIINMFNKNIKNYQKTI